MALLRRGKHFLPLLNQKYINLTEIPERNSALFINGAKATDTFAYVTPHVDWAERMANEERLLSDLQRRRADVDLDELKSIWQFYSDMVDSKNALENNKAEVGKKISELTQLNSDPQTIEKYKIRIAMIKENLKSMKTSLWSIEENAITRVLKVPNELHERTPNERTVIHTHIDRPLSGRNHLDAKELIIYDSNKNYYLRDDAAIFELGAKFYFSHKLKKHGFVQFSNPDFVKSVVVEGCGTEHTDSDRSFILHHTEDTKVNPDSRTHLVGGASLHSYFAYYTKNILNTNSFPCKYFTMGRKYIPSDGCNEGLFNVNQSSAIEIFCVSSTYDEMNETLDDTIKVCKTLYSDLGYHYRLSYAPAEELFQWESLRVSIEMFSSSLDRYIEVGKISVSGDYISKRLMLTYSDKKQTKFPYIISGTIMRVPRLLACILEQGTEFQLPKQFKVENWSVNHSVEV